MLRKTGLFPTLSLAAFCSLFILNSSGQTNPIVTENRLPGSTLWKSGQNGLLQSTEGVGIQGYASATSVNQGDNITFYVSVASARSFAVDIFRMGWYGGAGGRLMEHTSPLSGVQQPSCTKDLLPPSGTGLVECNWFPSYTLLVPTSWTSGIYLAHLTAGTYESYIVFVVREDARGAALLYQQPVATYQAYNAWGGRSLYSSEQNGTVATKVSFDRPYDGDGSGQFGSYVNFPYYEIHFVHWLEQMGYDVKYSTSIDTHVNGPALLNYKGFLSVGHDEYWSKQVYDAIQSARDSGVNLGFLGANAAYWQIRYESSSGGVANRIVVCYRSSQTDPTTDPSLETINWRAPSLGRPEQQLIGIQFGLNNDWPNNTDYIVTDSSSWIFTASGFVDGSSVAKLTGQEIDNEDPSYFIPANITYSVVSRSPFTSVYGPTANAYSTIYQAPGGAYVFAAGTLSWSWALENWIAPNGYSYQASTGVQQTAKNILDLFVGTRTVPTYSIYAIDGSANLYFYKDAARNGVRQWDPNSGSIIGNGWNFKQVFSGGNGIVYAIDNTGYLYFYKDTGRNGVRQWDPNSGSIIGNGWNFKQVFSGGNGVIYAIDNAGYLYFYRDLAQDGIRSWDPNSGSIIGNGWNFEQVFSGGNGVIYAIDGSGNLFFYKDLAQNGSRSWHPNSGSIIGNGWNFKQVFSGGNGIIYAIDNSGFLYFYKDLARDGTRLWAYADAKVIGNGWAFNFVFGDI